MRYIGCVVTWIFNGSCSKIIQIVIQVWIKDF
jgi:hypothetical protein